MGFLRGIGLTELLIILFIILLVFGTARLPKLAGSMGKAVREFRKATGEQERVSRNGHQPPRSNSRPRRSRTRRSEDSEDE